MKEKIRLTKSEREIMDTLWESEDALTKSEITQACVNRSWTDTSCHLLIRSLLAKNAIEVAGFKKTTRNYARAFKPSISQFDYFFQENFQDMSPERKRQFIEIIIQNASLEELDEIQDVLSNLRS